ncbi:hypothetical protein KQX54_017354 [Cotesia glomerata]|uniref:Uncharacterized protein n=1 Tax=Cotesia glomerata TaxID=32391 RepID=A0AAV7II47_COTGL|nr:hypothetical protein KQX54_017354 [Cotesia glomerata]
MRMKRRRGNNPLRHSSASFRKMDGRFSRCWCSIPRYKLLPRASWTWGWREEGEGMRAVSLVAVGGFLVADGVKYPCKIFSSGLTVELVLALEIHKFKQLRLRLWVAELMFFRFLRDYFSSIIPRGVRGGPGRTKPS